MLLLASFFRFWAGYSLGLLSGSFLEHRWPDQIENISISQAVTIIGGGLPASMIGGFLADKLEERAPSMRGLIAGLGALIAVPFIFLAFVV